MTLALLAATLAGCSGFSIGVRQDKEDREAFVRALGAQRPGGSFRADALLAKPWTRLWVFRGGVTTPAIEERIGIPFPESGEDTPPEASYLVFDDGEAVVAAFTPTGLRGVRLRCFLAEREPFRPETELTLVPGGGTPSLSTRAAAAACR